MNNLGHYQTREPVKSHSLTYHFLVGASFTNIVALLFRNKFAVSPRYLHIVAYLLLVALALYPFHLLELILYSRKIKNVSIRKAPLFIIGHWRSGTTYMHNLLCRDEQFSFPKTDQCFSPGTFMTTGFFMKFLYTKYMPKIRPGDHVQLHKDFPQEEEFAMNALTSTSCYQSFFFPRNTTNNFRSCALMENGNPEKWKKQYSGFLKKIALHSSGKQMVLKNPVNTVRIKQLLQLFPEAKFIYLYRDKKNVIESGVKFSNALLKINSLQAYTTEAIRTDINWVYEKTMEQYAIQKKLIPADSIIEISYEQFIADPLNETESIYRTLKLGGFEEAKGNFKNYIAEQAYFVPNTH